MERNNICVFRKQRMCSNDYNSVDNIFKFVCLTLHDLIPVKQMIRNKIVVSLKHFGKAQITLYKQI